MTPQQTSLFPELAREDWIKASLFHPLDDAQVLKEVLSRVEKQISERSMRPVVLLDLDSTLYEVGPRTYQILKEWAASPEGHRFASVQARLGQMQPHHVGYSLRDTFGTLELLLDSDEVKEAWGSAKKFWDHRFFTSDYLQYDHAYSGAADFAHDLHRLGAEVIYLTGRDEPGMGRGTRARLLQDGFPWEVERTHLLMKAAAHLDDLDHKLGAATYVRERGVLIASFENEPKNVSALHQVFPEAMHVFMDTVYSDHPSPPREGLYRLRQFKR